MSHKTTEIYEGITDYKSLTPAQQIIVKKVLELEKQYGKDNIFLRYITTTRGIRFIVHFYGKTDFKVLPGSNINGRVVKSLLDKGLATCCDSLHNMDVEPNSYKYRTDVQYVGVRICTSCINWWDME